MEQVVGLGGSPSVSNSSASDIIIVTIRRSMSLIASIPQRIACRVLAGISTCHIVNVRHDFGSANVYAVIVSISAVFSGKVL